MLFTLKQLEEKSQHRPQGYYDDVLALSIKRENDFYELSDENYVKLAEKYRMPSILQELLNLSKAAGQAIVDPTLRSEEEKEKCLKICAACPWLIEQGYRCGICGCFLIHKVKLQTWHCPKNFW
jgi:hypothetical protein